MKQLTAFIEKEFTEVLRNSKFMICAIIFFLLGIMNPAIAKITPLIIKEYSDANSGTGIMVQSTEINALTSWEQFFRNMPLGIIVFVLMFSGIVVNEIQKGTLINVVTKGMSRWKIIASKGFLMVVLWTVMYFFSYIITYVYNAFYWDNDIAKHLFFSAFCLYFLGVWLISIIMLMSACANNSATVSLGTCGVFIVCYLLNIVPKLQEYLPIKLMESSKLPFGIGEPTDFVASIIVVGIWSTVNVILGISIFNKKNL